MPNISSETQKEHINRFVNERHNFVAYKEVLEQILTKAAELYAPLGIVQARTKTVSSFSEKIIRKDKYKDPLQDMTDLCGARVITQFSDQVTAISKFIEENFIIDQENSLDLKSRLRISEFGYRSIHYIVTPRKLSILGIAIPEEVGKLKAEIQVRTFHEHIWADIIHDRIYKSSLNVTDEWRRESARLAAVLEQTDRLFSDMSATIDRLSADYNTSLKPEKWQSEVAILESIIGLSSEIDKSVAKQKLRLAILYNSCDEWLLASKELEPLIGHSKLPDIPTYPDILREYGYAQLCLQKPEDRNQKSTAYQHILKALSIYQQEGNNLTKQGICYKYLATAGDEKHSEYVYQAYECVPSDPYHFSDFLLHEISVQKASYQPLIDLNIARIDEVQAECQKHVSLGIEILQAHLVKARMSFLKGDYKDAADTYLTIMRIVMREEFMIAPSLLKKELQQSEVLEIVNPFWAQIIQGFIHLLLWKKFENNGSKDYLSEFIGRNDQFEDKVLIFCGNSAKLSPNDESTYFSHVTEALSDFEGTVISGGTSSGLPGLVADAAYRQKKQNEKGYDLLGYLPESADADSNYDVQVETKADLFSVLEPLSYWTDLLLAGVNPENITVLGIHGGFISSCEYKLGLLFGARVCLISRLGGSALDLTKDKEWNSSPNLFEVPDDPFTVWAIMVQNKKGLITADEAEELAPEVHEFYREKRRKELKPEKETDIDKFRVVMKWDKLTESLKDSNRQQITFMEHVLKRGGLKLQKSTDPEIYNFVDGFKTLDTMASLEHARWNAERLLAGWKFGEKDVMKKITPYLLPWKELPGYIKIYDYDPIKDFPRLVAKIGYEIVEADE